MKMPADVQGNDLVVRKSDILVWDGSIRTLKAANDQSTRGIDDGVVQLEEVVTRDVDDQFALSAFAQTGSQSPGSAADLLDQNTRAAVIKKGRQPDRQYIASRGKGSVIADIIPNKGDSSVRIEVQTMDNNETIAQLTPARAEQARHRGISRNRQQRSLVCPGRECSGFGPTSLDLRGALRLERQARRRL